MTAPLEREVRAKISARTDQALSGFACAKGCEKQEVIRLVLDEWAEKVIHDSKVILRFTASEGEQGRATE